MPRRGYYLDPADPTRQRMWDGEQWVGASLPASEYTTPFPGPGEDGRAPTGAAAIACPHCGVAGRVERERVRAKRGISGGKATGAVLTGGISLLGTGLARKEWVTAMRCGNCGTSWTVS